MKDKQFLSWIYKRLEKVHNESSNIDYMLKLKSIIDKMDPDKSTPNCCSLSIEEIDFKTWIDNCSYIQLLRRWRFAPSEDKIFHGEIGLYYKDRMAYLENRLKPGEKTKASKQVGWDK